jgi:hypothetical protein
VPKLLGRFIKNIEEPEGIYTPAKSSELFNDNAYLEHDVLTQALGSLQHERRRSLYGKIQSLFKVEVRSEHSSQFDFSAKILRSVRLDGYDDVFDKFIKDPAVRKKADLWRDVISGKMAYMVVGVLIWEDADLRTESHASDSFEAEGTAKIREALGDPTAPLQAGDAAGDISLGGQTGGSQGTSLSGKSEGPSVFAILYKVIKRSLFSSNAQMSNEAPSLPAGRSFAGEDGKGEEETVPGEAPSDASPESTEPEGVFVLDADWDEEVEEVDEDRLAAISVDG